MKCVELLFTIMIQDSCNILKLHQFNVLLLKKKYALNLLLLNFTNMILAGGVRVQT